MILNDYHSDVVCFGKLLYHGNIAPGILAESVILAHDESICYTAVEDHVLQIILRFHVLHFVEIQYQKFIRAGLAYKVQSLFCSIKSLAVLLEKILKCLDG